MKSILQCFDKDKVAILVGAHPDDDTTLGPLLAYAADCCREVVAAMLTHGEAGWNLGPADPTRTLAEVRQAEFENAGRRLRFTPVLYDYINGTSRAHPQGQAVAEPKAVAAARWQAPGGRDSSVEAAYARWTDQGGDPADKLLDLFREKQPAVVLALDPQRGFTGHEEHVAATRAVVKALAEYNLATERKAQLFYVFNPGDNVEGAERIMTPDLVQAGGRDYLQVSIESWSCYESQYGPWGSEQLAEYVGNGVQECLVQEAVTADDAR